MSTGMLPPEYALAERGFREMTVCHPGPSGDDLRRDCGQRSEVDGEDAREMVLV